MSLPHWMQGTALDAGVGAEAKYCTFWAGGGPRPSLHNAPAGPFPAPCARPWAFALGSWLPYLRSGRRRSPKCSPSFRLASRACVTLCVRACVMCVPLPWLVRPVVMCLCLWLSGFMSAGQTRHRAFTIAVCRGCLTPQLRIMSTASWSDRSLTPRP